MKKEVNLFAVEPIPLMFRLLRNWYWFVLLAGLGYGMAQLYLRYQIPMHRVEASLMIKEGEEENIGRQMIVDQIGFDDPVNLEDEIFYLKSSPLMLRVIEELGIDITYFSEGRVITSELYRRTPIEVFLLGDKKQAEGLSLAIAPIDTGSFYLLTGASDSLLINYNEPFDHQGLGFMVQRKQDFHNKIHIRFSNPEAVAKSYSSRLQIYPMGRSKILNFSLIDAVPEKARDIISKLMEFYALSIVEEKNVAAEGSLKFIDERLAFLTEELYRAEKNVQNYQQRIQAPVGIEQMAWEYSSKITQANEAITDLSIQKDFLNNLSRFLEREDNQYKLVTVPKEVAGDIVGALASQYNDLLMERQQLLLSADINNPYVKLMDEQIKSIKNSVIQSVDRIKEDVDNQLARYNSQLNPAVEQLNQVPQQQRELISIMRQKNIKEELYLYLLQNRERAGLSIASQTVNTRVINPPVTTGMVSPDYVMIYTVCIVFGLCIPLIYIVGGTLLDNTIHDQKDIKEYTDTPILGHIGLAEANNGLVVQKGSRSAVVEMFHLLRTNLQFLTPNEGECEVILLTSGKSGDGKTFIAANLGASLSLSGQKTLLIGFDLRKPALSTLISGHKSETGVSNYLIGAEPDPFKLIHPVEGYDQLYYMGSGPIPPNPTDLIHSPRTGELISLLRDHYDIILIDTSPVGLVTDGLILGQFVDASIFITRFKETKLMEIGIVDDIYEQKKLPNLSIVLNAVRKGSRYGYSYGDKYGYGYYEKKGNVWTKWWNKLKRKKKARVVKPRQSKGLVKKSKIKIK